MSRICCWHPVLTAHQAYTLLAFGEAMGRDIRVIACAPDIAARQAQGWTTNDPSIVPVEILPSSRWRARIDEILHEERDSIHIFGSPFERSRQNFAMAKALWRRYESYLISEPYSPVATGYLTDGAQWKESLKAFLRPRLYSLYGRLLRGRLDGVFAISPTAVTQYRAMGIDPARIFGFGYFVPLPPPRSQRSKIVEDRQGKATKAGLRVAYLGSFIRRKGITTLIEAFRQAELRGAGATLTLFGSAPPNFFLPPDAPIRLGGALPFGEVYDSLSEYDLLVVPSLYDGWAVVVNEAIGAGLPVLASDLVGAGPMVEEWRCGGLFPAGDSNALARQIAALATNRRQIEEWKARTPMLADMLQPEIAGTYMRDCIAALHASAPAPRTPWFSQ